MVVVHDATYWDLPASSAPQAPPPDHQRPEPAVVKPVSRCELRLPEYHLRPVSLTREQNHAYGVAVHAALGSDIDPTKQSKLWLWRLQLAMY